jgi:hypothetical protein
VWQCCPNGHLHVYGGRKGLCFGIIGLVIGGLEV